MKIKVEPIEATDTYPLRHRVMNPELKLEDMYREGDENADHLGAFVKDNLVGVISLYPQKENGERSTNVWRIRGMAVESSLQGRGIGTRLLDNALEYLGREYLLYKVWCNARDGAQQFYENYGFEITDKTYLTQPSPGTRYRMELELTDKS